MEVAVLISEALVAVGYWSCCLEPTCLVVAAAAASQRKFWTVRVHSDPQFAVVHQYCPPADSAGWECPFGTAVSWFAR